MRAAVVNLTSGNLSGGYQKYLERLMPLLRGRPEVSDLRVYAPHGYTRGTPDNPVEKWPAGSARETRKWILRAVREFSPDVVFIPTARLLTVDDIPTVVMVRNMEPLVPEAGEGNPLRDRLLNTARRFAARRACKRATRVIAVSEFVRDVIQERWQIPGRRIGVVHHGVEQRTHDSSAAAPGVERWAGGRPFLFTAGSIRPARGLDDIIDAWPMLRQRADGLRLVIAGSATSENSAYARKLRERIASYGATGEVLWAGQLEEREMSWCYSRAAAFVMTSRVEACPNVVLEAMANGAVSISTDARPMPEMFGATARYYRGGSHASLGSAVMASLDSGAAAREEARAAARRRAADFTWSRTAELTVAELACAVRG